MPFHVADVEESSIFLDLDATTVDRWQGRFEVESEQFLKRSVVIEGNEVVPGFDLQRETTMAKRWSIGFDG